MAKYTITSKSIEHDGRKLYQIKALIDFGRYKKGDLGGYVEHYDNLSQFGNCWVADNALVYGNGQVRQNALILDNSKVYGNGIATQNTVLKGSSELYGNARAFSSSQMQGHSSLYGNARLSGSAYLIGYAKVFGHAHVFGDSYVNGDSEIYGNAKISGKVAATSATIIDTSVTGLVSLNNGAHIEGDFLIEGFANINFEVKCLEDYLVLGAFGKHSRHVTISKDKSVVNCGCFSGNLDRFKERVKFKYGESYGPYNRAIKIIDSL